MDWQKVVLDLLPYVVPSVVVALLEWKRRKADTRKANSEAGKVDADASKTMVDAAQGLVGTSGILILQMREQLTTLEEENKQVCAELDSLNSKYAAATEELASLSLRVSGLRDQVMKLTNSLAENDQLLWNLRRCLGWCLRHLRDLKKTKPLADLMRRIELPSPLEEDVWISRAELLNGEAIDTSRMELT